MKQRHVCCIMFYTEDKKVLMQERKSIRKYGEEWGLWGGGIDEGETKEECIIREIKEELDYELEDFFHIGQVEGDLILRKTGEPVHIICEVFVKKFPEDTSVFTIHEGDSAQFFTMDDAKKLKVAFGVDEKVLDLMEKFLENL